MRSCIMPGLPTHLLHELIAAQYIDKPIQLKAAYLLSYFYSTFHLSRCCSAIHPTQHAVRTFNSCTSRPDVCQCLVVQTSMGNMSKNKPDISIKHVDCESKLLSVVRSSMHPWPGNLLSIGRWVVYYARATYAFRAGIKCRHCTSSIINCILATFYIYTLLRRSNMKHHKSTLYLNIQ